MTSSSTTPGNGVDKLQQYNSEVRQKILSAQEPYLGLIDDLISPAAADFLRTVLNKAGGRFSTIEQGLKKFPALFAAYMIKAIREDHGQEDNKVYGCLNQAMGRSRDARQPSSEREKMWHSFRRACSRLQLPLSNRTFGTNYMIDAYLEQVGVPDAFLDQLWERMERFAHRNGLPDEHDLAAQKLWYSQFCGSLNSPFPVRTRRALENDTMGFYLTRFLSEVATDETRTGRRNFSDSVLPVFQYDGDSLLLKLSSTDDYTVWEVDIDGEKQKVEVVDRSRTLPVDDLDFRQLTIRKAGTDSTEITYRLWQDERDNQFAFFNADNHTFVSSHSLREDGVALDPGRYIILSRFEIDIPGLHTPECYEEGFFSGELELNAGSSLEIKRGPVSFIIKAHSHAVIEFNGKAETPYEGPSFFSANTLQAAVKLPEEWGLGEETYELEFRAPELEQQWTVPLQFLKQHQVNVPLGFVTASWPAGVDRIVATLRRTGQKRPLARASALVWTGLDQMRQGFKPEFSKIPDSLKPENCENIRIDEDSGKLVIRDKSLPFFKLYFKSARKQYSFRFALPGTYIYLDDPATETRQEKLIRPGSMLSATISDRRKIRIYSTEPGALFIGDHLLHDNFQKRPWVKYRVAALIDHINSENSCLRFVSEYAEQTLVELLSPHHISGWECLPCDQALNIEFKTYASVDSLVITATELFSGRRHRITFDTNTGLLPAEPGKTGGILVADNAGVLNAQQLSLHLENLSDGAWFFQVSALINGRWGTLSNQRADQYACSAVIFRGEISDLNIHLSDWSHPLIPVPEKNRILKHTNELLRNCYALECWEALSWLKSLWLHLLEDAALMGNDNLPSILPFTDTLPDETAAESWVPMLHIGGYKPYIYARNAIAYNRIDTGDSINLRCLRAISDVSRNLAEAIKSELLSNSLVTAFTNTVAVINNGHQPRNFSFHTMSAMLPMTFIDRHWQQLLREGKEPAFGDLAGGYHLAYAQHQLLENLRRIQSGNDNRRRDLTRIALRSRTGTSVLPCLVPPEFFSDEQEREIFDGLTRVASHLAYACRRHTRTGEDLNETVFELMKLLQDNACDQPQILSFFLSVADCLFHYYLLLWEIYFESKDV
ncbi:hypothetical protein [Spongorhabdus nitratireducens]